MRPLNRLCALIGADRSAVISVALVALFAVGTAQSKPNARQPALGGDFTLTDTSGRPFSLRDVRGKVVLLSFGYTYCPDVCPLTLSRVSRVMKSLGDRAQSVVPLFVSLDPKRDTPAVLQQYVRYFDPRIIGLTGDKQQLKDVAVRFGVQFAYHGDPSGDRYTLDHTASLYILDSRGRIASIVPYGLPAEHILQQVIRLLPKDGGHPLPETQTDRPPD
jgi:cytochrome oxidase Cu insertion factor (SCO1/SenC/PrrC family)